MLRLGLTLVALAGVAELLLGAGGILVGVGLGGSLVSDLWPLAARAVAWEVPDAASPAPLPRVTF